MASKPNGANGAAAEWIKLLFPPLVAAAGGYLAIRVELADLSAGQRALRREFELSQASLDHAGATASLRAADAKLRELEAHISQHRALGDDGVPHPAGCRAALRDLQRRLEALEAK